MECFDSTCCSFVPLAVLQPHHPSLLSYVDIVNNERLVKNKKMDNNNLNLGEDMKTSCPSSTSRRCESKLFEWVSKLPELLAHCVFVVIHCVLKYTILISSFLVELKQHYTNSTRTFAGRLSFKHVERDISNLNKLPKHMSYVVNEDVGTDNYCDLANLVVWTIAMGIPYISLYDRHGKFTNSLSLIFQFSIFQFSLIHKGYFFSNHK